MLWTNFSVADVLIVISLCINLYYTVKLIDRLERRVKALEDGR